MVYYSPRQEVKLTGSVFCFFLPRTSTVDAFFCFKSAGIKV